ncbi:MAG: hypothetical protein JNK64_14220 [Myxococcales bacterium]|nr:hypothetical protein [Myxococcales bacterium]
MAVQFDRDTLVAFASPSPTVGAIPLRLRTLLEEGLAGVSPQDPIVRHRIAVQRARLDAVEARFVGRVGQHRVLRYTGRPRSDIHRVLANYGKRLPLEWQRWLWWTHWCYEQAIPVDLPLLLDSIEALIAVEAQLQVDGNHPNRDHIVHQLADAEVAVNLHHIATPGYDDGDWDYLRASVGLLPSDRQPVTRAGLCLAGMFHDLGYLRYVGASARQALATNFGIAAPVPSFELWSVMESFAGSYLDRILSHGGHSDGLVADVFRFGWDNAWHGPLSALVLMGAARRVELEGRASPRMSGALQVAAAAAFLHELHPGKPDDVIAPVAIREARRRIRDFAWPALFRIVDELQCWCRPKLVPDTAGEVIDPTYPMRSTLHFGARGASIAGTTMTIQVQQKGDAKGEVGVLRFLCGDAQDPGSAHAMFKALGVTNINETT